MSARIQGPDLDLLRAAIAPLDTPALRLDYQTADIQPPPMDLNRRYRWDLLWAAVRRDRAIYDVLQPYSDGHIDTALRAIVPTL